MGIVSRGFQGKHRPGPEEVLGDVFVAELTTAVGRCDGCGATESLGGDGERCWDDLRALRSLQFGMAAEA